MSSTKGTETALYFEQLPADVLLSIFRFLDAKSLCRLSQVCQKFNNLSSDDSLWKKIAWRKIFTSSEYWMNQTRCLSYKEQCRLSQQWMKGHRKVKQLFRFEKNYMPWMMFSPDVTTLYLAKGDSIQSFSVDSWMRSGSKEVDRRVCTSMTVHRKIDICRFFVSNDCIVTGGWYGKLSWFTRLGSHIHSDHAAHESHISDVAMFDSTIVSGSRDETVKIWHLAEDRASTELQATIPVFDKVHSVAINKFKSTFAMGTGGLNGVHPLQVRDLSTGAHICSLGTNYKNGAGVLDCHFQTPHTLMSAGYDTFVRLWDTRIDERNCVREWMEPHDNTIYCVASDCRYGFVTGSCRHGVVRLWDTRMKNSLQTFYLGSKVSSPVYTLELTHTHLFAGLARGIFALDFR